MKKYQVGLELSPDGSMKSSKGLISGKEIENVKRKIKLNKKRNTYLHVYYDENQKIIEIWKLNKSEYDKLRCGFGLTDFGNFIHDLL